MLITNQSASETAREYALRVIKDNIIMLELEPGKAVSENELAVELGMSRTPVREALQELKKFSLVDVYPQRGCVISKISLKKVEEAAFVRRVMETAIAQELCSIITEAEIMELEQTICLQEFYIDANDTSMRFELDNKFHRSLYRMCGKEWTYDFVNNMQANFDRVRALSLSSVKDGKILSDHKAILKAISLHDKELAGQFVEKHLSRYKFDKDELMEKYPDYFQQ